MKISSSGSNTAANGNNTLCTRRQRLVHRQAPRQHISFILLTCVLLYYGYELAGPRGYSNNKLDGEYAINTPTETADQLDSYSDKGSVELAPDSKDNTATTSSPYQATEEEKDNNLHLLTSKWPAWRQPNKYKPERLDLQRDDPLYTGSPSGEYRLYTDSDTQYELWNNVDKTDVGNTFVYSYNELPKCGPGSFNDNLRTGCILQFPLRMTIDSKPQPEKGLLTSTAVPRCTSTNSCAVTVRGVKWRESRDRTTRYRKPNQDRGLLIHAYTTKKNSDIDDDNDDDSVGLTGRSAREQAFVLLADGHGPLGHLTAEFTIMELPMMLWQYYYFHKMNLEKAVTKAFLEIDDGLPSKLSVSGSTAVLAWQYEQDKLLLASVGDSFGYLAAYNQTSGTSTLLKETVRHKPSDIDEYTYIVLHGGLVRRSSSNGDRVFIPDPAVEGGTYSLAMSRVIGDTTGKDVNFIRAEPSVELVDLSEYTNQQGKEFNLFLFVCSDGVMNNLRVEYVLNTIGHALYYENNISTTLLEKQEQTTRGMQEVLDKAAKYWALAEHGNRRDDMTLMVSKVTL